MFANRFEAALFLAGLAAFWSGFLILAVMLFNHDPHLGRHALAGPGEVAAILMVVGGGIALGIVQLLLVRRFVSRPLSISNGPLGIGMQLQLLRLLMPRTIAEAARLVGLHGTVTAGVLYAILIAGVIAFFEALGPH